MEEEEEEEVESESESESEEPESSSSSSSDSPFNVSLYRFTISFVGSLVSTISNHFLASLYCPFSLALNTFNNKLVVDVDSILFESSRRFYDTSRHGQRIRTRERDTLCIYNCIRIVRQKKINDSNKQSNPIVCVCVCVYLRCV